MSYVHTPVLLNEVIKYLDPRPGQNFVDATLGGGGYASAILDKIKPHGKVLVIDLDEDAINNFKFQISNFKKNQESEVTKQNLIIHHGNFRDLDKIISHHGFPAPDGIVADLGLSSYQLDESGRGISFQKKEVLDMRFDKSADGPDAKFILNNYEKERLLKIFKEYGEEKFAGQIVKKIQEFRTKNQIKYTTDLHQIIVEALFAG